MRVDCSFVYIHACCGGQRSRVNPSGWFNCLFEGLGRLKAVRTSHMHVYTDIA